ncbi:MAG: S26 family signal peptidase [Planctomycetota bacterium]
MRRRWQALAADVLVVTVAALVTFQALKRGCGDYYRVPTHSMEPALHGDPDHGDVVFVEVVSAASSCRRQDLVVVRNPHEAGGQLVKRIAARGDDADACWINLLEGDVWLGPDAQHMWREVKDPIAARGLRVPWARWPGGRDEVAGLELPAAGGATPLVVHALGLGEAALRAACTEPAVDGIRELPGAIGTKRAIDAAYLDLEGRRGREGEDVGVRDVGLDMAVDSDADTIVAVLSTSTETITWSWRPRDRHLELWRDGADIAAFELPAIAPGIHRVELGRLDARAFFLLDDRRDTLRTVDCPAARGTAEALPFGPRSHFRIAALGAKPLVVHSLLVFRDVFAYRDRDPTTGPAGQSPWPFHVPPGQWFLLGDNSFDSRDSRSFGAVPTAEFLGRPLAVIGPWARTRWLVP